MGKKVSFTFEYNRCCLYYLVIVNGRVVWRMLVFRGARPDFIQDLINHGTRQFSGEVPLTSDPHPAWCDKKDGSHIPYRMCVVQPRPTSTRYGGKVWVPLSPNKWMSKFPVKVDGEERWEHLLLVRFINGEFREYPFSSLFDDADHDSVEIVVSEPQKKLKSCLKQKREPPIPLAPFRFNPNAEEFIPSCQ